MTKLSEIQKGKRVCDELLEDIDDIEEQKILLVHRLIKNLHIQRKTGETFMEHNLRFQKHILQFIRDYENKIIKFNN